MSFSFHDMGRLRPWFFPWSTLVLVGFVLGGDLPVGQVYPTFQDVTQNLGVRFQHVDGRSGERFYVETAASGGGWLDYDGDGDQDLYLINGALTPGSAPQPDPRNALYENRDGQFVDVTGKTGLGDTGYGMGLCVGDVNGDGLLDIFVTNFGPDRLYLNQGKGRFREVAQEAGVAGNRWGTNCAFGDLDGDGDLDLYVANYVNFSFENNPKCGNATTNTTSYCRPTAFSGLEDYLYINQGDGTFREEAKLRGIQQKEQGKCFGVLLSDADDDGDLDIFVASDGTMNRFFQNDGKGYFKDESLFSGLGYNEAGEAEAGMGMDLGDVDGNGLLDLVVTNYSHETNTLYLNRGDSYFEDATRNAGLAEASLVPVGWGVQLFDADNDGDLDLAVANGHVIDNIEQIEPGASYPQPNQLFTNDGKGKFRDVSAHAGKPFEVASVSRGMALADWNNDGLLDLLVTNTNGPPHLLKNTTPSENNWVGLRLKGPLNNSFAIGARVILKGKHYRGQREVRSGGSFLSQADLRLHFGLGKEPGPLTAEIRWPDGKRQSATLEKLNRYHTLTYSIAD